MKSVIHYWGACLLILTACQPGPDLSKVQSDLEPALEDFASYEFGQPKKVLHDTRMTAYRGTEDRLLRLKNEQLLLEFIQSDATVLSRREACMWLSDLGSKAAKPVLQQLAGEEAFADVAQMALDAINKGAPTPPTFDSAAASFQAKLSNSSDPLPLLTEALAGQDEDRARQAFEWIREGSTKTAGAPAWLEENISTLPPQRQIIAMNVLLEVGAPQKEAIIVHLSRKSEGAVQQAAIRHLGFLQRKEDVSFLMDHYQGRDAELAAAARVALRTLPLNLIKDRLMADLQGSNPGRQAKAIELVEWTGAAWAQGALIGVADDPKSPNRTAAIRALGRVAPPDFYEQMIQRYLKSTGTEVEAAYKEALWDHSRKQPDYEQARQLLAKMEPKGHRGESQCFASD
jgi:hypothetical protein